jgi:phosphoglucosamine mutase
MSKKLFGTDGVRGHANREPMTVETALALGRAAGMVFRRRAGKHRVVIGKDTRLSGYMIESALVAGLNSMGVDTLMLGPLPTPAVAYITRAYRADAGIVISASHNPYFDNGIKFFSPEGFKLERKVEQEIEQAVANDRHCDSIPQDHEVGKNARVIDGQGRYIEFAKSTLPRRLSLEGLKIVIDCANGAGYRVAPLALEELGAEVITLGVNPDGLNINLNCGALHPETMGAAVREHGAHVGIALDGDADRVIMVDEQGRVVDGDTILALCARDLKEKKALRGNAVVGTVMTNLGVIRSLEKLGIEMPLSGVGDRLVIHEMRKRGLALGGEQSGHIIFLDHNTTGDGLVSGLQVLRVMVETGRSLSDLAAFVEHYPQHLINVAVCKKPPLDSLQRAQSVVREIEKTLGEQGRVLVRYSGTERICRVMVEGADVGVVEQGTQAIAAAVQTEIGV